MFAYSVLVHDKKHDQSEGVLEKCLFHLIGRPELELYTIQCAESVRPRAMAKAVIGDSG